jgi:hypothetical protein
MDGDLKREQARQLRAEREEEVKPSCPVEECVEYYKNIVSKEGHLFHGKFDFFGGAFA